MLSSTQPVRRSYRGDHFLSQAARSAWPRPARADRRSSAAPARRSAGRSHPAPTPCWCWTGPAGTAPPRWERSRATSPCCHCRPKAPSSSPVGNVWQYLRQNQLSLRVRPDDAAIAQTCCRAWNALMARPDRLASSPDANGPNRSPARAAGIRPPNRIGWAAGAVACTSHLGANGSTACFRRPLVPVRFSDHPLRAPGRHPSCLPHPRLCRHLLPLAPEVPLRLQAIAAAVSKLAMKSVRRSP